MKRLRRLLISLMITALMAAGMPMTAFAKPDWPSDTGIESEAGIVMDADSGAVLFGQNIHVQKAPASITKILTALVVIENSSLDDTITFSHDAVYNVEDGSGNKNAIEEGDTLSVRDCLYLLLMRSSNQAANALAEHVGGSRDGFVKMMNEKTAELGCENSHFANPSGLNDDTQLTSVYDMALIASAVYQTEEFQRIEQTLEYKLGKTNLVEEERILDQNHKMLWPENYYYYPYAKAGKTGYTDQAKTTLVTMADNGNMRLAAVVLGDYGVDAYEDTRNIFEYGFGNFRKVMLSEQPKSEDIDSFADSNAYVVLPEAVDFTNVDCEIQLSDSDGNNADMATAVYTYQGNIVGKAEVKVSDIYKTKQSAAVTEKKDSKKSVWTEAAKDGKTSWKGYLPVIVMGVITVAILFVFLPIWLHLQRKRRKNRRRR